MGLVITKQQLGRLRIWADKKSRTGSPWRDEVVKRESLDFLCGRALVDPVTRSERQNSISLQWVDNYSYNPATVKIWARKEDINEDAKQIEESRHFERKEVAQENTVGFDQLFCAPGVLEDDFCISSELWRQLIPESQLELFHIILLNMEEGKDYFDFLNAGLKLQLLEDISRDYLNGKVFIEDLTGFFILLKETKSYLLGRSSLPNINEYASDLYRVLVRGIDFCLINQALEVVRRETAHIDAIVSSLIIRSMLLRSSHGTEQTIAQRLLMG